MRKLTAKIFAATILASVSSAALAHPGHNVSGLAAGLMHPFSGLDHLLAMVAVGLWAAQGSGRKVWLLPVTFMTTSIFFLTHFLLLPPNRGRQNSEECD